MAGTVKATIAANGVSSVFLMTGNFDGAIFGVFNGGAAYLEKSQDGVNGWGPIDLAPRDERFPVIKVRDTYHFFVVNSGENSYRLRLENAAGTADVKISTNQ
jgi:hypothetical protein